MLQLDASSARCCTTILRGMKGSMQRVVAALQRGEREHAQRYSQLCKGAVAARAHNIADDHDASQGEDEVACRCKRPIKTTKHAPSSNSRV